MRISVIDVSGPTRPAPSSRPVADDQDLADPPAIGRLDGQRQAVDSTWSPGLGTPPIRW